MRVSWAEPKARFTALFERFAIQVMLETSIQGAGEILGLSWDEAHHIMERAVVRGLARRAHAVPQYMGIDEKSLAKGQRYATMVCDLEHGHVIELAEGRSKESLLRCLGRFSINELSEVKAIAMDMWAMTRSLLKLDWRLLSDQYSGWRRVATAKSCCDGFSSSMCA